MRVHGKCKRAAWNVGSLFVRRNFFGEQLSTVHRITTKVSFESGILCPTFMNQPDLMTNPASQHTSSSCTVVRTNRRRAFFSSLLRVILPALLCMFAVAASAQTTWTVNTLKDSNDGSCTGSVCSLRDAITTAANGDRIVFQSGLTGTITLASPLPAIGKSVTITGPGAKLLTISGNGKSSVISINSGAKVAISGLTMTDGYSTKGGAAISNSGTLTITGSTLYGNATKATEYGFGGAIYNLNGTLTVSQSTFYDNSASQTNNLYLAGGGAIYNSSGTVVVSGSVFYDNAAIEAGTLSTGGYGGAICSQGGTLTVSDSTFYGNSATHGSGGAIYATGSTATVVNSTFSANSAQTGGAIDNYDDSATGSLNVTNSIFANDQGGGITNAGSGSDGYNVFINDGDSEPAGGALPSTDRSGTHARLSPLGWYGGPTQSMILLPGSQAICTGSTSNLPANMTTDQRGFALDPSCPAGSVDAGAVQTNQFVVTNTNDSGTGSLRAALTAANAAGQGDITFAGSLNGTIALTSSLPAITSSSVPNGQINLLGPGTGKFNISAGSSQAMIVDSGANAFLFGMTVTSPNATGGTISNLGTLTISDSVFSGRLASVSGSVISNQGTLTVTGSTFSKNSAASGASAISNQNKLTVTGSTFSADSAVTGNGGAISNDAGSLMMANCTFSADSAPAGNGGAIYNSGGTLTVTNSTFAGDSASTGSGGAIFNVNGILAVVNSVLSANSANQGGAIFNNGGSVTESYNDFYNNAGGDISGSALSSTDQTGDPKLAVLGHYGGTTQTMPPLAGSAALNTGKYQTGEPATDQRGAARPATSGAAIDIGAVQVTGNPPMIFVSPNSGPDTGGTSVTITGTGLGTFNGQVDFGIGGQRASATLHPATATAPAYITAISPVESPGTVNLVVYTTSQRSSITASDQFTYLALGSTVKTSLTATVTPSSTFAYNQEPTISVALNPSGATGIAASDFTAELNGNAQLQVTASTGNTFTIALPSAPLQVNIPYNVVVNFSGVQTASDYYAPSSITIPLTVLPPTLVVSTTADDLSATASNCIPASASCTLRDALQAANQINGANITFAPSVFSKAQTITLNSQLPWIASNVTIQGPGAKLLTISGGGTISPLEINGGIVHISGLTFANASAANDGGAIYNNGANLTVTDTAFSGNSATNGGAIMNQDGTLAVTNSSFTSNSAVNGRGGAISNASNFPLTITSCAFSANSAGIGAGAIDNASGTVSVANSTFSKNSTSTGDGGAISSYNGSVSVTYSTFSGNSASTGNGGAISDYYGGSAQPTLTVTNDTFSGNSAPKATGGAISNTGPSSAPGGLLSFSNNIFSGNSAAQYGGIYSEGQSSFLVIADSHNVFYNNAGGNVGTAGAGWTLSGSDVIGKDPMLAALGNYGGPSQTMIPLPGSAAICEGSASNIPTGVTTDQRGYPNTNSTYQGYSVGTPCVDAGSVQTDYALDFSTQPPASVASGANFSAAVTLKASGNTFTASPVSIPLSLASGDNGVLSGGSAKTSGGVASYSGLSVSAAGTGDMLTANLTLNSSSKPPVLTSATSNTFDATAGVESQAITFNNPGTQTVGTPLALVATASSGLTVSFASTTPSVCTVSGTTATFAATGTCSITASQAGNGTYATATPVTQSFKVNAAVPSFALSSSSSALTIKPGASGTATLTVTPASGLSGKVSFACSGLPAGASCSFSPTTVSISGVAAQTTTLTITSNSTVASLQHDSLPFFPEATVAMAFCLMGFRKRRRLQLVLLLVIGFAGLGLLSGCGGGGSIGGGGGSGGGTKPITSTVTVTATSGSLQQTVTISLTVE